MGRLVGDRVVGDHLGQLHVSQCPPLAVQGVNEDGLVSRAAATPAESGRQLVGVHGGDDRIGSGHHIAESFLAMVDVVETFQPGDEHGAELGGCGEQLGGQRVEFLAPAFKGDTLEAVDQEFPFLRREVSCRWLRGGLGFHAGGGHHQCQPEPAGTTSRAMASRIGSTVLNRADQGVAGCRRRWHLVGAWCDQVDRTGLARRQRSGGGRAEPQGCCGTVGRDLDADRLWQRSVQCQSQGLVLVQLRLVAVSQLQA